MVNTRSPPTTPDAAAAGPGCILLTHTPRARALYFRPAAVAALRALGAVRLHEAEQPLDAAGLIAAARGVAVIVCDPNTAMPAGVFDALPGLGAACRVAVDIRTVDVGAASLVGVLVTRAGPGFVPAVTELVVGLLVGLARGISAAAAAYWAGAVPARTMGRQLAGSTLGIIGYGAIGRALAQAAGALGMEILVADPKVAADGVRQADLGTLLAGSDFVVCLAAATPETAGLMDAAAFARMRPGACFINASRGELVDEAALAEALRTGHLGGAALDVGLAPGQMPPPALSRMTQVIATPHIGGLTPAAVDAQAFEVVAQVAAILRGEVPPGAVNAEAWRRR